MTRRHPPGLYVLFFTEMWERFSFYCMLSIFVLYMKQSGDPLLEKNASMIYGVYLGAVYFTPFVGGWLADWKLGYNLAIVLGALVMGLGHLFLAFPQQLFFFAGLVALCIGNGLFKPNISTLVGKLYEPGDPRIDGAFTIFYMGINLGAFIAPLVAQYLRNRFSFHAAFGSAGIGMGVSILIFLAFRRWVVQVDQPADGERDGGAAEVPAAVQRNRHIALLIIFVIVALFWMAFKQNGNTFTLWARDSTDRTPPAWLQSILAATYLDHLFLDRLNMVSTELFQCVNPFFVIVFSPLLVWFWQRMRSRGLEPSTPGKIALGMGLTGLALFILTAAGWAGGDLGVIRQAEASGNAFAALSWLDPVAGPFAQGLNFGLARSDIGRVSPSALLSAYAVITVAELCLSPMGLSLVTKLAARKHRSAWMGGWFVATAVGSYLAGAVGMLWDSWRYSSFFALLAGTSLLAALIMLFFFRKVRAAMPAEKEALALAPAPPERPPAATASLSS